MRESGFPPILRDHKCVDAGRESVTVFVLEVTAPTTIATGLVGAAPELDVIRCCREMGARSDTAARLAATGCL